MNAYITPRILPNIRRRLLVLLLTTSGLTGCGAIAPDAWDPDAADRARIALAEQFITTFYRWDAAALGQLMLPSDEASNALYYQAWAEAANYAIKTRRPCRRLPPPAPSVDSYVPIYVECRITVTDDFGQALGYTATDTFTLEIAAEKVRGVTFAGDDPPVFQEVFGWLSAQQPELFTGVCKDLFAGGTQPAECARAIAAGARAWAAAHPQSDH